MYVRRPAREPALTHVATSIDWLEARGSSVCVRGFSQQVRAVTAANARFVETRVTTDAILGSHSRPGMGDLTWEPTYFATTPPAPTQKKKQLLHTAQKFSTPPSTKVLVDDSISFTPQVLSVV